MNEGKTVDGWGKTEDATLQGRFERLMGMQKACAVLGIERRGGGDFRRIFIRRGEEAKKKVTREGRVVKKDKRAPGTQNR